MWVSRSYLPAKCEDECGQGNARQGPEGHLVSPKSEIGNVFEDVLHELVLLLAGVRVVKPHKQLPLLWMGEEVVDIGAC